MSMSSCGAHAFAERECALVDHLADDSLEHARRPRWVPTSGVSAALGRRPGPRGRYGIARVVVVAAPALAPVLARGT